MQVNGASGSLMAYYAELARQKTQSKSQPSATDLFGKVDTDASGGVSISEFSTMLSQHRKSVAATSSSASQDVSGSSDKSQRQGSLPPEMSEEEIKELFNSADTDDDGNLSLEEFSALNEKMRPPPPPARTEGASGRQGGKAADLLSLLNNNSIDLQSLFGAKKDSESSSNSLFSQLTNAFNTGDSASDISGYLQTLVKNAYVAQSV